MGTQAKSSLRSPQSSLVHTEQNAILTLVPVCTSCRVRQYVPLQRLRKAARTLLPAPARVEIAEPLADRIDQPEPKPQPAPPLLPLPHEHLSIFRQTRPLDREPLDAAMQVLPHRPEEDKLPLAEEEQAEEGDGGPDRRGEVFEEAEREPHEPGEKGEVEREEGQSGESGESQDGESGQKAVSELGLGDLVVGAAAENRASVIILD